MSKKPSTNSNADKISTSKPEVQEEKNILQQSVEEQKARPGSFAELISK
jgi:hypothetical protein